MVLQIAQFHDDLKSEGIKNLNLENKKFQSTGFDLDESFNTKAPTTSFIPCFAWGQLNFYCYKTSTTIMNQGILFILFHFWEYFFNEVI